MKENTNVSLQLLLLNDLFHSNVIDQSIYDKAVQKIIAFVSNKDSKKTPVVLATT